VEVRGEPTPLEGRDDFLAALKENRARRGRADAEVAAARTELGRLLSAGARRSVSIPEMARVAGIGMDVAYLLARNTWGAPVEPREQIHAVEVEPLSSLR
jgi:hypothetical protein